MSDSGGQILIVDDEDVIREFVSLALSDEGYQITTACDGLAAFELINQQKLQPALILLDMRMPRMDGWTFCKSYRNLQVQHAPIIVMSAATDARAFARQVEANDCLPKPFELDELIDLVGKYVAHP